MPGAPGALPLPHRWADWRTTCINLHAEVEATVGTRGHAARTTCRTPIEKRWLRRRGSAVHLQGGFGVGVFTLSGLVLGELPRGDLGELPRWALAYKSR